MSFSKLTFSGRSNGSLAKVEFTYQRSQLSGLKARGEHAKCLAELRRMQCAAHLSRGIILRLFFFRKELFHFSDKFRIFKKGLKNLGSEATGQINIGAR